MTIHDQELAEKFGSPLFVLDKAALVSAYQRLHIVFNAYCPTVIAYSYKTNYLPFVCKTLADAGSYAEIIPGFEFDIAQRLGVPGSSIVVNGPYKPADELRNLVRYGCRIHVDNFDELSCLAQIAEELKTPVEIAIRVTPDLGPSSWSKFGFSIADGSAHDAVSRIAKTRYLSLVGLHMHIGTDVHAPARYRTAMLQLLSFYRGIADGVNLQYIDVGGGFPSNGIQSTGSADEKIKEPIAAYAKAICEPLQEAFHTRLPLLILEPGRYLVDDAFFLLTTVAATKMIHGIFSVIVDAGVNILPSAYYRVHQVENLFRSAPLVETDIYGPLCMQDDLLESGVLLPKASAGDLLRIQTCGAYELSQSIQFIRPRPPVVCIGDREAHLIRRQETIDDILVSDVWGGRA